MLEQIYSSSLSTLTDLYQLTSAYSIWKSGKHNIKTCYYMFYRDPPFGGGYAIFSGLEFLLDWVKNFHFTEDDIDYLKSLTGNDNKPLFEDPKFFDYLLNFKFNCKIFSLQEGTIVFPQEPLVRVEGTIIENFLIETALLCFINSQTLFATKASRIKYVAGKSPVLEFGLRRAQGADGSISVARATYIGGADATSNVFAGKLFNIPVKGTHPHGFVMFFDSELEAFQEFAKTQANNCVFLVDTYNTINGIKNAIKVSLELKEQGHKPIGIRLDSGDLDYLSRQARKMLDDAGLTEMSVFVSNDLDEKIIESLKNQGSPIGVFGVGTKMVTCYDQPALGGVYKMSAIYRNGIWEPKIKLSEQIKKTTTPGRLNIVRFYKNGQAVSDMIVDEDIGESNSMIDPFDNTRNKVFDNDFKSIKLLEQVYPSDNKSPSLNEIKKFCENQKLTFDKSLFRLTNPHQYPVGLEVDLYQQKINMIQSMRNGNNK